MFCALERMQYPISYPYACHALRGPCGSVQGKGCPRTLSSCLPCLTGHYVYCAVCVFSFGQAPILEIIIIRIMSRFFCLLDIIPGDKRVLAEVTLVQCLRGRAHPRCPGCPLERKCRARQGVTVIVTPNFAEGKVAENPASYS